MTLLIFTLGNCFRKKYKLNVKINKKFQDIVKDIYIPNISKFRKTGSKKI